MERREEQVKKIVERLVCQRGKSFSRLNPILVDDVLHFKPPGLQVVPWIGSVQIFAKFLLCIFLEDYVFFFKYKVWMDSHPITTLSRDTYP